MKIVTVRLNEKHVKILERLSEELDITKSDVIRYSLELMDKLVRLVAEGEDSFDKLEKVLRIIESKGETQIKSLTKELKV